MASDLQQMLEEERAALRIIAMVVASGGIQQYAQNTLQLGDRIDAARQPPPPVQASPPSPNQETTP